MSDIFSLQGSINVDTGKVSSALKDVSKGVDDAGKGFDDIGNKSSKLGTVLGGLGTTVASAFAFGKIESFVKSSVEGAEKSATANAKLEEVLKSASHATDEQVTSLKSYASELSKTGVISAGLNKTAMSQLGTFGLQSDSIKKLIPQLDNLAVNQKGVNATSEDMMGYANMIGKAMQGSATAMTRVGVTMTDAQKKIIETGTEEQKASTIAEVLASNYGNLNDKIAETPEGKAKILENNLASLKTQLGTVFLPIIGEVVGGLKDMVTWFTSLSPTTQKVIMVIGLVVALLPTLIGMISGVATIIGVFSTTAEVATVATEGMAVATTGLSLPFLAIVAVIGAVIAIGVLLYKNWDTIKEKCAEMGTGIHEKWEEIKEKIHNSIESIKEFFKFDWHLPKIELPHFNIEGSFSLNPPSIPHIGVEWYWKGGIFNQPTMLGNIGVGDKYNGQGSNAEAIIPLDTLWKKMDAIANRPINIIVDGKEIAYIVAKNQHILEEYNEGR